MALLICAGVYNGSFMSRELNLVLYPPSISRNYNTKGLATNTLAGRFGMKPAIELIEQSNWEITLIAQLETIKAYENLDQILDVPGIDVFLVSGRPTCRNQWAIQVEQNILKYRRWLAIY